MRQVYRAGVPVASTQFDAAVSESHELVTVAEIMLNGVPVIGDLAVVGGSVQWDRRAATLARCDIELMEPTRLPVDGGPLSPFGYEIRLSRGIRTRSASFGPPPDFDWLTDENGNILTTPDGPLHVSNGAVLTQDGSPLVFDGSPITFGSVSPLPATLISSDVDVVFLGVFPIQRSSVDGVSLLTSIQAMDRSQRVRDARFEDDYSVAAGTNYATAIEALIADGVPDLEYLFPTTNRTTPLLTFDAQSDRWESAQGMARALGHELFFDGLGRVVMRPEPSLADGGFDVEFVEGEGGVLVDVSVELDRQPAYNRWVAFSENAANDEVYRGVATDDEPSSPTYYFGPFGKKPRFYSSPFIASDAQAQSAADSLKAASTGVARSLGLGVVPNPRVEPGDAALIRRAALGVDEIQLVDEITMQLGPEGEMRCASRARQVQS